MQLIVAEKPSVAQSIAAVLGAKERRDGYIQGSDIIVSWCVGHLVGLAEAAAYDERFVKWCYEDLPILPERWQLTAAADKGKQLKILSGFMNDKRMTELVCATDAGREGELIFRFVYELAGCKKPFKRLWISSMEESAIREGFAALKDGREYDNLYHSALCRAKADWLVGINATRLFRVLYGKTLNVGRVQTPTLAMLVERQMKISGFQKEKYHLVALECGGFTAKSDRIERLEDAKRISAACDKKQAAVSSVKREQKTVHPPRLYDLTTLQREANRIFGYTAKQTLDLAQALYEKKLCTYPRTDSQFLTADMKATARRIVELITAKLPYLSSGDTPVNVQRVINSAKVSDHHAIIPTAELEKADLAAIPETERNILSLICCKLLCAVAEPYSFETVIAAVECGSHSFTAKGKSVVQDGWKATMQRFRDTLKVQKDEAGTENAALPPLTEGQTFDRVAAAVTEHFTLPPKPYTEDTLLSAMETAGSEDFDDDSEKKGLGTPATRAAIIEKLVSSGFAERRKKQLIPTQDGINLISVLPEVMKSPQLTAEWEAQLTQIARGPLAPDGFMCGIETLTADLVRQHHSIGEDDKKRFQSDREVIGTCPRCGGSVHEGKHNFYCHNRDCRFTMWKNDRFFEQKKKQLTKAIAAELLKSGRAAVKGLYSEKTGKTFDAVVLLSDTGEKYVNYRLDFSEGGCKK